MPAALDIAAKDIRLRIRDGSAFIVGLLAPFGLALIFSLVFSPIEDFEFEATYAVVDDDGGPLPAAFESEVLASIDGIDTVDVDSVDEAVAMMDTDGGLPDEEAPDAAFVFPSGFTAAVQSGQPARFEVIGNEASETNADLAVAFAEGFAAELNAVRVTVATAAVLSGGSADPEQVAAQAVATPSPLAVVDVSAETRQLDGTTFYAAGLAVFFLFFTVQFGVNSLLDERRDGTLQRLLAAPISGRAVILGKALAAFVLGVVSVGVLVLATSVLLGADWGAPIGVGALVLTGVFAAVGVMALSASFVKTAEHAAAVSSIIGVVLGFLGGTFFPIAQAGGLLATLRFVTPHAWFMLGLGDLSSGQLSAVFVPVVALLMFGLATGGAAFLLLRRRYLL